LRIGVFCPNWVGDSVMAIPFINSLRYLYPEAIILAICKSHVGPVFQNHPALNGVIQFEKKDLSGIKATANSGRSLKANDLDLFYLLSDSYRAAYLAYKSESPMRIGYSGQGRTGMLTKTILRPKNKIHRHLQYINLIEAQKIENYNFYDPGIILKDQEIEWAKKELANLNLVDPIAFFPFSIASSRSIPQSKIESFLNNINENDVLIFGGINDSIMANKLIKNLEKDNIRSIAGDYSLRQSISLISQCKAAIASDSGLGHISANIGVPTVSLFGAGDPDLTKPIGNNVFVINQNVHCSPCLKNKCHNRRDPLLCLEKIEPTYLLESLFRI